MEKFVLLGLWFQVVVPGWGSRLGFRNGSCIEHE